VYSSNLGSLVAHFWDKTSKAFALRMDDEILKGCLITHGGQVVHPAIRERIQ
jgi:H+-translocating NAD(P) transhydrogenase subunit alpha